MKKFKIQMINHPDNFELMGENIDLHNGHIILYGADFVIIGIFNSQFYIVFEIKKPLN